MSDPGEHVVVARWGDIDNAPEVVSGREKQQVAAVFREQSWDYVVWMPGFVLNDPDRDVELLEASEHLAVGTVKDYSDDAWQFHQPHRDGNPGGYLPKSQVVVFERLSDDVKIDTPQRGLTDYE